jgi:hypothetical protein
MGAGQVLMSVILQLGRALLVQVGTAGKEQVNLSDEFRLEPGHREKPADRLAIPRQKLVSVFCFSAAYCVSSAQTLHQNLYLIST